jgi:hypothetical protein
MIAAYRFKGKLENWNGGEMGIPIFQYSNIPFTECRSHLSPLAD